MLIMRSSYDLYNQIHTLKMARSFLQIKWWGELCLELKTLNREGGKSEGTVMKRATTLARGFYSTNQMRTMD